MEENGWTERCLSLPRTPQFPDFSLQALQLLLQFLIDRLGLSQLCLQLGYPLVFRFRKRPFVSSCAHLGKSIVFLASFPGPFGLSLPVI